MSHKRFTDALAVYARELHSKYSLTVPFDPEDQLKKPMASLIESAGQFLRRKTAVVTESRVTEVGGRPDLGVTVDALLCGHVELKAPGKGADPTRLKGADKGQWEKFKDLPNLVYTDGNEWSLWRQGEKVGRTIKLAGDATTEGAAAADERSAGALLDLLWDFLNWRPITPASPRVLAELLAPLCRYLRTDVLMALKDPESNLSSLAADWRKYLFPDADDRQFADAYAQTLTYALLLARIEGAGDV